MPDEFRAEGIAKIRAKVEDDLLKQDISYWCAGGNAWQLTVIDEFYSQLYDSWQVETDEDEIDWGLSWVLGKLGDFYTSLGYSDKVRIALEKGLQMGLLRVQAMPENVDAQQNLSVSYEKLGNLEKAAGNTATAREFYEKLLEIAKRLAAAMPENVNAQLDLSAYYNRLGDLEMQDKNYSLAKAWFEKSLRICEELVRKCPNIPQYTQDLQYPQYRLAQIERLMAESES